MKNTSILLVTLLLTANVSADLSQSEKKERAENLVREGYNADKIENYGLAADLYKESLQFYTTLSALTNLCNLYLYGLGVEKDYKVAKNYCARSANYNHPNALTMLGEIYLQGKGVSVNIEKATDYYERAADLGHIHAQYVLYLLLKDSAPTRAQEYLRLSAEGGHPKAKNVISVQPKSELE